MLLDTYHLITSYGISKAPWLFFYPKFQMTPYHQALYDQAAQTYNNVCVDGKTLLDTLQQPVAPNQNNALTANADYTSGATHVLDLIHEILTSHRQIDQYWHSKKVRLHQRLGLRLFQQDVKQVLDWLDNHGEMFLRKNTSIGRTLAKARLLRKSHQHFEAVLQVTFDYSRRRIRR